jgi:L-ascorbate metabolism protein UlaG (beta-lactamase superfamily)
MRKIIALIFSAIFLAVMIFSPKAQAEVKIKWLGQSCFLLTSPAGAKILIDPYSPDLGYPMRSVSADVVLITHEHFDHNYFRMASGNPKVIHGINPATGEFNQIDEKFQDVRIYTIHSYHYEKEADQHRGPNAIMVLEMPGLRLAHLGDLGRLLTTDQVKKIGNIDCLMIPVGGVYTITAEQASQVVEQLKPKLIFPMHYKTDAIKLALDPVDKFLAGKNNIQRIKGNEFVIKSIPQTPQIIVLDWK